jgi:hypothetical protein
MNESITPKGNKNTRRYYGGYGKVAVPYFFLGDGFGAGT